MELWGRGLKWYRKLQATHLHHAMHSFFTVCETKCTRSESLKTYMETYDFVMFNNWLQFHFPATQQRLYSSDVPFREKTCHQCYRISLSCEIRNFPVIVPQTYLMFHTTWRDASAAGGTKTTWVGTILLHLGQCTACCVRLPSFWRRAKACETNRYKWVASHA